MLLQQVTLLHELLLLLLRRGPRRGPGARRRAWPWHLLLLPLLLLEHPARSWERKHGLLRWAGQHLGLRLLGRLRLRWPLLLLRLPLLLLCSPDTHAVQLVQLLRRLSFWGWWAFGPGVPVAAVRTVHTEAQLVHVALHSMKKRRQRRAVLQTEYQAACTVSSVL